MPSMNTKSSLQRMLQYGLNRVVDQKDLLYTGIGESIFQKDSTERGFYEAMMIAGAGLPVEGGEAAPYAFDSIDQKWAGMWPVRTFRMAFKVTLEAQEDNIEMGDRLLARFSSELRDKFSYNRDYQMAQILLRSESGSYTGKDGVALLSTSHPIAAGGTQANKASVDAVLSESSLEAMLVLIDTCVGDDGLYQNLEPKDLIIAPANRYIASRLLDSPLRSATADNDVNAIKFNGMIKDTKIWKHLQADSDSFFVTTNAKDSLIMVERKGLDVKVIQDELSDSTIVRARERFAPVFLDFRGVFGSLGV